LAEYRDPRQAKKLAEQRRKSIETIAFEIKTCGCRESNPDYQYFDLIAGIKRMRKRGSFKSKRFFLKIMEHPEPGDLWQPGLDLPSLIVVQE
jgi:hypothetical protein